MKKSLLLVLVVVLSISVNAQKRISPDQARKYMGEKVTITGKIVGSKLIRNQNTILNMGDNGSNVAIVINNSLKKSFSYNPDSYYSQKLISVTGTVIDSEGRPAIVISGPQDIKVQEVSSGGDFKPLEFEGFNRFFQE